MDWRISGICSSHDDHDDRDGRGDRDDRDDRGGVCGKRRQDRQPLRLTEQIRLQ